MFTITSPRTSESIKVPDTRHSVDPWKLQASVMAASGQSVPEHATFSKHTLTYIALVLEEVGELCTAMYEACGHMVMPSGTNAEGMPMILESQFIERTRNTRNMLQQTGQGLGMCSRTLRGYLANPNNSAIEFRDVPEAKMVEVLDGICDSVVVLAGLAVSSGLPGAAAFQEVAHSNLSKANPETGVIDLDDSGKWIKGPNYFAPELAKLITKGGHVPAAEREPGTKLPDDLMD